MITSLSNPKVKQVAQWQSKARERRKSGVFLAEGFKMFEEAPEEMVQEVYLSDEAEGRAKQDTLIWKKLNRTGFEKVTREVFSKMSDTQTPQGVLTVLKQPEYDFKTIIEGLEPLLLLIEDLQDPGNLGTIIRTGEGAGVTGVIMSSQTVDIFNPKTIRSTMGSIYRVPFVYVDDMELTIKSLHKQNINTYAAHLKGENYFDTCSFHEPTAFFIGNEGGGLKQATADMAKAYVKIPMEGKVESLNAAIAASLLMYEAHRQRSGRHNEKRGRDAVHGESLCQPG